MLFQDIRYGLRNLARSKGFATVAILCLGFGVGLNATIFSLIDGVLLKPYPYTEPDRLLIVGEQRPRAGREAGMSYLDLRDWKEANSVFRRLPAPVVEAYGRGQQQRARTLPRRRRVVGSLSHARHASDSWTGLHRRGRSRGSADVVLLGYDVWMHRYAGSPEIVGQPFSSTASRTSSLA